jgi:zinc protease
MLAAPSIRRGDPSYAAVEVANALLGGTVSARLSREIRIKRGLTYDASSEVDGFHDGSLFRATVQTGNARAAEVAGLMLDQLDTLRRYPPTADELAARKAHLIGDFGRDMETGDDLADLLASEALYGAGAIDLQRYPAEIAAITADQASAAVARLADPARTSVLVVGDMSQFLPALRARFGNVAVLPAPSLDADSLERLRSLSASARRGAAAFPRSRVEAARSGAP